MDLQEIDVFIEKDGRVRIEVRGAKGMSCLDLTKDLEAALAGQIEAREMTPEALRRQVPLSISQRETIGALRNWLREGRAQSASFQEM